MIAHIDFLLLLLHQELVYLKFFTKCFLTSRHLLEEGLHISFMLTGQYSLGPLRLPFICLFLLMCIAKADTLLYFKIWRTCLSPMAFRNFSVDFDNLA